MLGLLLLMQTPEALVARLGDENYAVRESATATLLDIGRDALPALRRARHNDPEARIRADILIRNITELRWTTDVGSDGPTLVFATYGGIGSYGDAAGLRMVEETFRAEPLIDYLNRHYRLMWFDMYAAGESRPEITWAQRAGVGSGTGLVMIYFVGADGSLVHSVEGFRTAAELLAEARAALDKPSTERRAADVLQIRRLKGK